MSNTLADQAAQLRAQLHHHAHLYYVLDAPTLPDAEYDRLFKALQALEAAHPELVTSDSPTQRVGGKPLDSFASVKHVVPMLSIRTETDTEASGAEAFDTRIRKELGLTEADAPVDYVAELKFDGLAISLRYAQHVLVQAATRGDGAWGEDVTHNIRTIGQIPLRLPANAPPDLEVRGEIYMRRDDFEALLNEQLGGASDGGFEGRVVKGTVTAVENGMVVIDVGLKSEGRIDIKEFQRADDDVAPKVGEEVEVYVDRVENAQGEASDLDEGIEAGVEG